MGLTRLAVARPLTILMMICGLVVMGLVARSLLKVDRMPANISFGFVNVSVGLPGAAPLDVEQLIVTVLEDGLAGLPGVQGINGSASEGRGNVSFQLAEGADADRTAIEAERRLAGLRGRLPAEISPPTVNRADPNAFPILNIVLSGRRSVAELYDLAVTQVEPALQSVLGVAEVNVFGGLQREVSITFDYAKLDAYGLSIQQITTALSRENISTPAGSLVEGRRTVNIRTFGQYQSIEEIGDVILASTPTSSGTAAVYLRDIATIKEGFKEQTRLQRFNGQEAVGISITKQADANSLQVADDIQAALARVQRTLPPDVRLVVTNDSSRFTRAALDAVQFDLSLAVVLTALVLLLFLHTWRNVLIVILAIPTSLISTFLVMWALGFTLNMISLMALALMIGILVDDSIVVLENIHRHLRLGEGPILAALNGRSEIGLAAIAITLTDIVVYLPIAFMSGGIGRMFREYGLTIAAATLFSLFISFTLTPMLASRLLGAHEGDGPTGGRGDGATGPFAPLTRFASGFTRAWEGGYSRLARFYGATLRFCLRARPLVILLAVVAIGAAYAMVYFRLLGTEYAPQEDDNQFNVSIQMPPGTAAAASEEVVRQVEAAVMRLPEVEAVFTSAGGGGGFGGGGGNISVQLKPKSERERSVFQVVADVRRFTTGFPEASVIANVASPLGGGGGGFGIGIRITGEDYGTMASIARDVEQIARTVPGVTATRSAATAGLPEVRARLDRRRMAELGVNAQQVTTALRVAIAGTTVTQLRKEGARAIDVTVRAADADRLSLENLEMVPVATTASGIVRLGQVARLERSSGPASINRQDRLRTSSVNATVADRPIGDVARDLRQALATYSPPPGYQVSVSGGQVAQLDAAFVNLVQALGLSVLLIYMLLVALYESWLDPLAIMFSLPVALVGAFGALLITGNTLNLFSMIGMIMLLGLVAKNAILLIDYTRTLRSRGYSRNAALLEAGPTRLRPILMTTCTILFAMLPLALKLEAGAESRAPMAVVVMGGVTSSMLLTLLIVPVVYTYLDDLTSFVRRLLRAPEAQPARSVPAIAGGAGETHEQSIGTVRAPGRRS
ncbi:MAG: efflux RND transporter permease subunit [Chloroflexi bacterium]|nr:efflux RND transporter permease subunit [Chloroflexota bacterium]